MVKKGKVDIQRKHSQFPPLFSPVHPLAVEEVNSALSCILDFISAHGDISLPLKEPKSAKQENNNDSLLLGNKDEPLIGNFFSSPLIARILAHVCLIFKSEPTLLDINFPLNASIFTSSYIRPNASRELIVCGDFHGSMEELLAVFKQHGTPPLVNYLFLGDYVDRGKHSLAVMIYLFLLKIRWPKHVYMLRGNHEAFVVNCFYGFREECSMHFPDESLFSLFNVVFAYMPLAAIVQNCAFCVHGGVSQWMTSRESIKAIPRPILFERLSLFEHLISTDIMWADPKRNDDNRFSPSFTRGCGFCFNEVGLRQILDNLQCTFLIRGHESKKNGVEEIFDGTCMTVHSTALRADDKAAVLRLTLDQSGTSLTSSVLYHHRNQIPKIMQACTRLKFFYCLYRDSPMVNVISLRTDLRKILHKIDDERFFRRNVAGQDEIYLWVQTNAAQFLDEYLRTNNCSRPKVMALWLFPALLSIAFGERPDTSEFSRETMKLLVKFSRHCGEQRLNNPQSNDDYERLEIVDPDQINMPRAMQRTLIDDAKKEVSSSSSDEKRSLEDETQPTSLPGLKVEGNQRDGVISTGAGMEFPAVLSTNDFKQINKNKCHDKNVNKEDEQSPKLKKSKTLKLNKCNTVSDNDQQKRKSTISLSSGPLQKNSSNETSQPYNSRKAF